MFACMIKQLCYQAWAKGRDGDWSFEDFCQAPLTTQTSILAPKPFFSTLLDFVTSDVIAGDDFKNHPLNFLDHKTECREGKWVAPGHIGVVMV